MTHANAIAALIEMDLTDTRARRVARTMAHGYMFSNLRSPLARCEARGFEAGDIVRETMTYKLQGFGYKQTAVHKMTHTEREQVVAALIAAGFSARLEQISGAWHIKFA